MICEDSGKVEDIKHCFLGLYSGSVLPFWILTKLFKFISHVYYTISISTLVSTIEIKELNVRLKYGLLLAFLRIFLSKCSCNMGCLEDAQC